MIRSRRRMSLLGVLALLAGGVALVLTKFNPTGIETVPNLPISVRLPTAAAIAATALALLAFLLAASSARTGAGLPLVALLVGSIALLMAWKPNLWSMIRPPAPAPKPAVPTAVQPPVQAPADEQPEPRVKTIFDFDGPSSAPPPAKGSGEHPAKSEPAITSSSLAASAVRPTATAAIHAARAKLQEARDSVVRSLESTQAYRAAKADVDAAEEKLKNARVTYDPGSPELIAASQAALNARSKLEELISAAASHDPDYQNAAQQLQAAHANR